MQVMTNAALRATIRALIASGALPSEPPVIQRSGHDPAWARAEDPCTICGEPAPSVSYFWPGGRVVRLHAACDALWKQEREADFRTTG